MSQTLYQISQELRALEQLLYETGGEITDAEAEAALDSWFLEIGKDRDTKLDNYASLIKETEHWMAIRKQEADRMYERAKVDEALANRLRKRLREVWELHKWGVIQTPHFRLNLVNNGGKQGVELLDGLTPESLPERFTRTETKINSDEVRAALEAGEELGFAKLRPRGKRVDIR